MKHFLAVAGAMIVAGVLFVLGWRVGDGGPPATATASIAFLAAATALPFAVLRIARHRRSVVLMFVATALYIAGFGFSLPIAASAALNALTSLSQGLRMALAVSTGLFMVAFQTSLLILGLHGKARKDAENDVASRLMLSGLTTVPAGLALTIACFCLAAWPVPRVSLPASILVVLIATLISWIAGTWATVGVATVLAGVEHENRFRPLVENICRLLDVKCPRWFIVGGRFGRHPFFGVWWVPGYGYLLLATAAAVQLLDDRELSAVLAHEVAHIRGRHNQVIFVTSILSACVTLLLLASLRTMLDLRTATSAPGEPWFVVVCVFGFIRSVSQNGLQRYLERGADEVAAKATDPASLISALQRLSGPFAEHTDMRWLTHDSLAVRRSRVMKVG